MFVSRRDFLKSTAALAGAGGIASQIPLAAEAASAAAKTAKPEGEHYKKTTCVHCVNFCGQNIKLDGDIIRAVYPDPDRAAVYNKGICPKGASGPFNTYNPYRIKRPLKRTNPKKGPHEDPGWVEISWQEALNEVADRLKKIRKDDPRKLIWHHGHGKYLIQDKFPKAFAKAFGTPNVVHRTTTCEAARHVGDELTWGHHEFLPDLDYCELQLNLGANYFEAEQWARWLDHATTDAQARGMKLISVEPRLSSLGAKADQWIPIRPGKDVVMLLCIAHELIKAGTIDREYLTQYTNACHLVGKDGRIVTDAKGEPLVWDKRSNKPSAFVEGVDPALEGRHTVDGKLVRTAFQVLKDEVAEITPEYAEKVTGIPAETLRQLAAELGEKARIGSTIVIDGKRLRYRPVAIHAFRGVAAKEYGAQTWRSGQLVMMLLGAHDAVGGMRLHHPKPGKQMKASKCEYPPQRVDLQESVYFPHATHNVCQQVAHTLLDPEAYGLPYKPEMQIFFATNRAFSTSDALKQFEGYAKTYNVVIDIVLTETASMADIVFPDLTYLEAWQFSPTRWTPVSGHTAIRQPMTNVYNIPLDAWGIIWELAKRVGIRDEYAKAINAKFKLKKHTFKTGRDYTSRDAVQILWEEKTGKPFSYALEHAFVGKRLSTEERYLHGVEKVYKGPGKPKMKLYADQLVDSFAKVKATVEKHGIRNLDLDHYRIALSPLPRKEHAFPTPHREARDYPFYLMTYKRMYRNQSGNTAQNPILNRLGDSDENYVLINRATADKMGIANDDQVRIETRVGSAQGKARVTEGIRPDVVAVSYHYGHFSPGFPDYAKKGIWINQALELHPDVMSGMNSFNDTKCKVVKV
ncbi:MAG: twin-arginine translocation signal domain-containing protein [Gammaproteobacteria bacterium]|nr:MAG: twin-arginine translocation signal domain-containing protein [Gammaproteobacteria bacterium]